MLFSQTAEYALRAMACLAVAEEGVPLASDAISSAARIPSPYVPKVMRPLVAAGLVEARRGRNGGFLLARPAADISFHDVLDASGALAPRDRCAFGLERCNADAPCLLHASWSRINTTVDDWAENTTLADIGPVGELPAPPT